MGGMGKAENSDSERKPYHPGITEGDYRAYPQPPKSRPKRPENLKCPECGGERLFRDGLRRLADGSATQRWLCRECGYRFSEKPKGKDLKISSALNLNRRVCAPDTGVENSAGAVKALMEEKADAESRAAGATENSKVGELLFNYAWFLKKEGYAESTIKGRVWLLKILARRGADLLNPESVKEAIARQDVWCNKRKVNAVDAYTAFLRMVGGTWNPPAYRYSSKLPFIPIEAELDTLINGCGPKTSIFLQILKETGIRAGEAQRLRWTDIDFERCTIRVTPEKGSEPRIFKVSSNLISRLLTLRSRNRVRDFERIFANDLRTIRKVFEKQRANIARKLQNPRINQIHFHTFRHWKATMLYHQTKDILYVMKFLGHKNIKNTLIYIQLEEAIFRSQEDEFICKAAQTVDEAKTLIEVGFEYVCDFNGVKLFRKRK
ncbi:MAG: site-specific integrase [Thermoproteota archaeon]